MKRTEEATLSRQNMSRYKTLYVEGDLDLYILEAFLKNNDIKDIRIYRISQDKEQIDSEFQMNDSLGAKREIINLIKKSNEDSTIDGNKYIGIVDLDFDYCLSNKENINNLIYTDRNSMESYLIDIDLFKVLSSEKKSGVFNDFETKFEDFIKNIYSFNKMFIFQLKYISELNDNVIVFDKIKFGSGIVKEDFTICTDTIIKKCKNSKEIWLDLYNSKLADLDILEKTCKTDTIDKLVFLHGKYTLKYILNVFKNILNIYNQVDELTLINMLKDKFIILRKFDNYRLFEEIKNFASK
ncbi:DUF4435 domain-containing protein [Aliarcobacter butzleri]|uniref:hypothetical protein n=1 Tax=Aliarcobacter butzleri TaxID=28197 RepID=UPI0002EA98A0|nr:hypothetical protein [Aliarcobacter butzleri]MCG3665172.1 DUF4435 domain-containing protein [Aliarcobacter butzleri]